MTALVRKGGVSLPGAAATAPYLRLKMVASQWVICGATDIHTAISDNRTYNTYGYEEINGLLRTTDGTVKMTAAGPILANVDVWGAASGKVTSTYAAGAEYIGKSVTAASGDGAYLEVVRAPAPLKVGQATVAASTAITASSTATVFDKTISIPANSLQPGDVIRVRGSVIATATNSTDTLTLALMLGSQAIITTASVDVANNDIGYFDVDIVIRTNGASGTMVAAGVQGLGTPGTVTAKPFLLGSTAVDTTAAQAVGIQGQWSTTNAGNSCRLDVLDVNVVRG